MADWLARPPPAARTYQVEAYVIARGTSCPPCPKAVVCSPCPPPTWALADTLDPNAPSVPLAEQPPDLAPGARYRLRVAPSFAGRPRIVAALARLAPPPGGGSPYDGCDECVSRPIEWGPTAANGARTVFTLEPCRGLTVTTAGGAQPARCTARLACGPGLTVRHLADMLAYSDVSAALARAPVVFGRDVRALGQPMLRISVDAREILVGPDCDGSPGCVPPPSGVAVLAGELTRRQLLTEDADCGRP